MAIKIKKNGVVQDLVINANEIRVLDADGNFRSKNLESVLKELNSTGGTGTGGGGGMLKEAEYVFVGDIEPDYEGVWLDTSEDSTEVVEGDNAIVKAIRDYIDTDVKATVEKNKSLVQKNNEIIKDIQTNVGNRLDVVPQLSGYNFLINGDFQIWQRGTSFSTTSSSTYSADRWRVSGFLSAEQDAKGIKIGMTASDNGEQLVSQYLEISKRLLGKTLTLSFDVVGSSNITGLSSRINDKDIVAISNQEYTVTTTTTKVIHTFTIPDTLTNVLQVDILFSVGQKIPSGEYVYINNVKLELGSVSTQFIPRLYGEELALCQRYYEIVADGQQVLGLKDNVNAYLYWNFKVEKRIPPTVTFTHYTYEKNHVNAYSVNSDLSNTLVEIEWTNTTTVRMKIPALVGVPLGSAISAFGSLTIDAEIY